MGMYLVPEVVPEVLARYKGLPGQSTIGTRVGLPDGGDGVAVWVEDFDVEAPLE